MTSQSSEGDNLGNITQTMSPEALLKLYQEQAINTLTSLRAGIAAAFKMSVITNAAIAKGIAETLDQSPMLNTIDAMLIEVSTKVARAGSIEEVQQIFTEGFTRLMTSSDLNNIPENAAALEKIERNLGGSDTEVGGNGNSAESEHGTSGSGLSQADFQDTQIREVLNGDIQQVEAFFIKCFGDRVGIIHELCQKIGINTMTREEEFETHKEAIEKQIDTANITNIPRELIEDIRELLMEIRKATMRCLKIRDNGSYDQYSRLGTILPTHNSKKLISEPKELQERMKKIVPIYTYQQDNNNFLKTICRIMLNQ